MTSLKQLLDHYCPGGVEYVRLGDVATVGTGRCDRKNATADGEFPFFVRSQQILRYPTYQFDEEAIIVPGEGGVGDIFHYINGKYALHQRAYRVHFTKDYVNTKFALYVFKTTFKSYVISRAVTATVSSLRKPMFTEFPIPLPPREVQDKIVEILDTFAALCENLDAEITQREQQFAAYREKLLSVDYLTHQHCPGGVEYVRLGDVATVGTGRCDRKNATADGEFPFFVRSQQILRYPTYQFDEEAIIVPGEGGVGDIFHYINGKYALHQRAYRVHFTKDYVNTKFALYVFKTTFKSYVISRAVTATVSSLRKPMFTEFPIPLPPREVQEEIVAKLDAMQALIDNLRLEREQRQKQFDYYREKLLSFPQKETAEV